jgi:transposase
MVIIGVDPHPGSHTAAALEETGKVLGHLTVENTEEGLGHLLLWCKKYEVKCCAVEGANNPFARSVSEVLLTQGYKLVNINPSLTSQYRSKRGRAKSDAIDAENIAKVALANPEIVVFNPKQSIEKLKTLTRTRALLVQQLTALRLSLRTLTLEEAQQALEPVIALIEQQLADLEKAMTTLVKQLMPELLDELGIGVVHAATLLAETGDPRTFRSHHSFAMFAGCAPVERSSGGQKRRQLNIGGNRILNRTFHLIAFVRLRYDDSSKAYLTKKQSEGKTTRAALRCLKTVVARDVFRFMQSNAHQHPDRWLTS